MNTIDVLEFKLKFNLDKNVEEFKDVIYSILTLASLNNNTPWYSAHVDEGVHGHIVYYFEGICNFCFMLDDNFLLYRFDIILVNDIYRNKVKTYNLNEYNTMYDDFVKLIS